MIAIVDYGMGNRRSVEKALEHVGAQPVLSADHDVLRSADGIVVDSRTSPAPWAWMREPLRSAWIADPLGSVGKRCCCLCPAIMSRPWQSLDF